jgi:hypothetical protein
MGYALIGVRIHSFIQVTRGMRQVEFRITVIFFSIDVLIIPKLVKTNKLRLNVHDLHAFLNCLGNIVSAL